MEYQVKTSYEIIDGKKGKIWRVERWDGAKIIYPHKLISDKIIDVTLFGEERIGIYVTYVDSNGSILYAIVDTEADIFRKGIKEIEQDILANKN